MRILLLGSGILALQLPLKFWRKNPGVKVTILEKEEGPARHQTGNNSGVIHAGVYYKPGSLKATNCRKGYQLLLDFCDKRGFITNFVENSSLPQGGRVTTTGDPLRALATERIRKVAKIPGQ